MGLCSQHKLSTVDKMGPLTNFLYCLRTQLSNPSVKSQHSISSHKLHNDIAVADEKCQFRIKVLSKCGRKALAKCHYVSSHKFVKRQRMAEGNSYTLTELLSKYFKQGQSAITFPATMTQNDISESILARCHKVTLSICTSFKAIGDTMSLCN